MLIVMKLVFCGVAAYPNIHPSGGTKCASCIQLSRLHRVTQLLLKNWGIFPDFGSPLSRSHCHCACVCECVFSLQV